MLPNIVDILSKKGIWTFFDIVHADRGYPGTKCKGEPDHLFLEERHMENFFQALGLLSFMRKNGFLIHNNDSFFESLARNYETFGNIYNWCCANYKQFPSWVTIDCDGTILPCDDFHKRNPQIKFHQICKSNWEVLFDIFREQIKISGCKCCWQTHIGAHSIKAGKDKIEDYIHGKV